MPASSLEVFAQGLLLRRALADPLKTVPQHSQHSLLTRLFILDFPII